VSLGFVVETERQVEAHLQGHLERLPAQDHASRAIVVQMKDDEAEHASQATGGRRGLNCRAGQGPDGGRGPVMTTTAHYI
jgi:ubiquinone biosynthesis monooxygenase Coq7